MFRDNPSVLSSRLGVRSSRRSVTNYTFTLRNVPKECKYYLHCSGSPKYGQIYSTSCGLVCALRYCKTGHISCAGGARRINWHRYMHAHEQVHGQVHIFTYIGTRVVLTYIYKYTHTYMHTYVHITDFHKWKQKYIHTYTYIHKYKHT